MINKVTLLGRLGRDAETRSMQDGKPVASFSVATSDVWKDKEGGDFRDRTEWHNVSAFGEGLVKLIERKAKKGALIYIEGKLRTRKYEKDGQEHRATDIILDMDGVVRFPERAPGEADAAAAE
jgi:single-strand DNA-binding protein